MRLAHRRYARLFDTVGRPTPPRFHDTDLPEHYPPDLELEPTHLDIDLYVSIPARSIGGRVTTALAARRGGSPTLKLNAVGFEDVAVRDTEGRKITSAYDGLTLTVRWEDAFTAGEVRRVEVAYRVVEPDGGLYFAGPDTAYPNQPSYVASDHETEIARHWLPCIDLPNVRTTLDFRLRADARHTILANGYLVDEKDNGDGTKTARWRLDQPCPSYLICIVIGDLIRADDGEFDDGEKRIPVAYFCGPEHTPDDLLRSFGRTRDMLTWMTRRLAQPFPYPKYYQAALPVLRGAMENISLVSWSDTAVLDRSVAPEYGWLIDHINVHEMAHSYFGDAVVCRDFAHAWLKESWATYIQQAWERDSAGVDAADYVYHIQAQEYFDECDNAYRRPIITRRFRSSWDMYDVHLYEGGACRLHMLNQLLGHDTFWAAVQSYLARYRHSVVETDDFRRVLEEFSGLSLVKFFDQWFHTPGFPDLKIEFEHDAARGQGTFRIEQKQVDRDAGIPAFEFSTDIGWTCGDEEFRVPIEVKTQHSVVTVSMPTAPDMVRFDPGNRVLHRLEFNPGDGLLRRQLTAAPDVLGRIQAAHTLATTGKHANISAIVDAFLMEPHWGVRCELATALAKADHQTAIDGLAQVIGTEQEPRVLVELMAAAAKYRSPSLVAAISERLAAGLRPIATQRALEALGKQADATPFDLLADTAQDDTHHWRVQAGALRGLGETRRDQALPILRTRARYGATRQSARTAAITALGALARSLERGPRQDVVEQLADHLRDPWHKAQWAAAQALGAAGDPAAIAPLEGYARTQPHQDAVAVERIVEGLRANDKADGSAVKKEVEDLRDKVRRLEQQLQTLAARLDVETPTP